ncbi:MAG: alkaline shock response membrane anchor protein AmaP [Bacillota bacterium]
MKIINNLISFFLALIIMVLSITVSLYFFGLLSQTSVPDFFASLYGSWEAGLAAVILFLAASFLLYPFFISKKIKSTRIISSESGDISITISALQNLIKDRVMMKRKIEDISVEIKDMPEGINIILNGNLTVPGDLPQISREIQTDLQDHVKETVGIDVNKVEILIQDVKKEKKLPSISE